MIAKLNRKGPWTLALRLKTALCISLVTFALMLNNIKFESSALNDPKMSLETTRSTLRQICTTCILPVTNGQLFASYRPFETSAPNDSK